MIRRQILILGTIFNKIRMDKNIVGYVCLPDLHNAESVKIKDTLINSKNIQEAYFVTATFPNEVKQYLSKISNLYMLAKCTNTIKLEKDISKYGEEKASFVFHTMEDLFERYSENKATFVSTYYLDYEASEEDITDVASVVVKRDRICKASICDIHVCSPIAQKFDFPYRHAVVLEIAAEQSHKKVNKYCEKTRRNVQYCGIAMSNMAAFSILEQIK
ncbi:MAG: hypothetical protein K8823_469 [Cenarchaeum symbiont of Oopsacas minuta]|nr:hypothetical protein [Cenarchaeum symbiont of Oopsacas minuta]